jgi:hypothetical protein
MKDFFLASFFGIFVILIIIYIFNVNYDKLTNYDNPALIYSIAYFEKIDRVGDDANVWFYSYLYKNKKHTYIVSYCDSKYYIENKNILLRFDSTTSDLEKIVEFAIQNQDTCKFLQNVYWYELPMKELGLVKLP